MGLACENWHAIIGQVSVQCGISPLELTASLDLLGIIPLRPSTLTDYGISETVTGMMMTGRSAVETANEARNWGRTDPAAVAVIAPHRVCTQAGERR